MGILSPWLLKDKNIDCIFIFNNKNATKLRKKGGVGIG